MANFSNFIGDLPKYKDTDLVTAQSSRGLLVDHSRGSVHTPKSGISQNVK